MSHLDFRNGHFLQPQDSFETFLQWIIDKQVRSAKFNPPSEKDELCEDWNLGNSLADAS